MTLFTRLCPQAIRFANLPWVPWRMLSATATILGGPAPRQAEKLKDRAGQIDLVKQARQLHPAPEISGNSWGDKHWMGLYTAIRIMLNAGHEKI